MKKSGWYVIIFIILLIVVAAFCALRLTGDSDSEAAEPTQAVTQTETSALPAEQPAQTETPAAETPEPTPTPTPEPMPEPTPEPTPEIPTNITASGSFASYTGTNLNLAVDWYTVVSEDGEAILTVTASAQSYSFQAEALWNSLTFTINGESYSCGTPAIDCDSETLTETPLGSYTITVPYGSVEITVDWDYRGEYGGVELDHIIASGTAYVG
ncbi:MAG: hypothetical protein LUD55_01080 [Oscillospiraceae bacterium]|nr:hypothetical protein [Oscillospiraceae bacterium]